MNAPDTDAATAAQSFGAALQAVADAANPGAVAAAEPAAPLQGVTLGATLQVHPSHSQPRCCLCVHRTMGHHHQVCGHPSLPVSLLDGTPLKHCVDLRLHGQACGPDGALYTRRPGAAA